MAEPVPAQDSPPAPGDGWVDKDRVALAYKLIQQPARCPMDDCQGKLTRGHSTHPEVPHFHIGCDAETSHVFRKQDLWELRVPIRPVEMEKPEPEPDPCASTQSFANVDDPKDVIVFHCSLEAGHGGPHFDRKRQVPWYR